MTHSPTTPSEADGELRAKLAVVIEKYGSYCECEEYHLHGENSDASDGHVDFDEDKALDSILEIFHQELAGREREVRVDERQKIRKLFDSLGMQFGASAGSATGVTVRNDFGEEFTFQLDRDAITAFVAHLTHKEGEKHE